MFSYMKESNSMSFNDTNYISHWMIRNENRCAMLWSSICTFYEVQMCFFSTWYDLYLIDCIFLLAYTAPNMMLITKHTKSSVIHMTTFYVYIWGIINWKKLTSWIEKQKQMCLGLWMDHLPLLWRSTFKLRFLIVSWCKSLIWKLYTSTKFCVVFFFLLNQFTLK